MPASRAEVFPAGTSFLSSEPAASPLLGSYQVPFGTKSVYNFRLRPLPKAGEPELSPLLWELSMPPVAVCLALSS